jgi:hypothetical protein
MYKGGALCYRDCSKATMANCGIGACSRDSESCVSSIINMVVDVISGIAEAVILIASFGTSSAVSSGFEVAQSAVKTVGKAGLKGLAKSVKNWAKNVTKDKFREVIWKAAKDKIKSHVTDFALNTYIKTMCFAAADELRTSMGEKESSFDFTSLDPSGISSAIKTCTDPAN